MKGSYNTRTVMPCATCGVPTTRRTRVESVPRCLACGVRVAQDNVRDIASRSGEGYSRWFQGVQRYVDEISDAINPVYSVPSQGDDV